VGLILCDPSHELASPEARGEAAEPNPYRPPARPTKAFFEKGGGWFAAEIETAKMTSTKRTLRDQEAACFLNRSSTEQTFLYLNLSLSLCFAFLFLKNSKSRRRDNTAPFPPRPKFKKK
jgi:hypothetical protein